MMAVVNKKKYALYLQHQLYYLIAENYKNISPKEPFFGYHKVIQYVRLDVFKSIMEPFGLYLI